MKILGGGADAEHVRRHQWLLLWLLLLLQLPLAVCLTAGHLKLPASQWVPATCLLAAYQGHEMTRTCFMTALRARTVLFLDALAYALRFLPMGLLLLAGEASLTAVLWCMLAGFAIWPLYGCWFLRPGQGFLVHFWRVWRLSRWLLLDTLATLLSTQLYLYALGSLLSLQLVAAVFASQNALAVINVVFMGVASYVLPLARQRLVGQGYDAWRRILVRATALVTLALAPILLALAAFSNEILGLVYGEAYAPFGDILLVLAFPALLSAFNTFTVLGFQTLERTDIALRAKLLSAVLALSWVVPGIEFFGVWGAVAGLAATPVVWALVYLFHLLQGVASRARVAAAVPSLAGHA